MAEATFAVTSSRLGEPPVLASVDATRLGSEPSVVPGPTPLVSSGRAIAGVTVRIADESGRSLAESTVGEIRVASSMLTAGYLENPEATSAALGGGELRTGDIGFMQDGELFVLGRADDMIIVAGRNLLPQDLEAVVDSVPGVVPGRSVAFGVDDDKDGTSHVVVVAETIAGEDRPALARWISSELLAQLDVAPRAVHAVDRGWLLKSTSGKISRRLNRQRYLSELAARASGPARAEPAADGSLVAFVRAAVTVALDRDCPDDDDSLILSGQLDSLALTRLLLALGERFGDRLPLPNVVGFHRFDSVDAICRLLEEVEQGAIASSRQTGASPRGDKLASFAGATGRFDLLILGSSTAYTIPGKLEAAAGISAFNLAIDMAMIADIYCVMRFALDRQDRVRRIIVGLDVFAFRPKDVTVIDPRSIGFPDLVKYLAPDDRAALAALGEAGEREFQRLRINLQRLIGWNPGLRYSFDGEHGDLIGDDAGVQPSGLRPDVIEQNRHAMAVAYGGFDRICPKQSEYLRDMARVATAAAIRIDFVIMPIHRALGDFLAEKTTYPARKAEVLDLIRPLVSETVRLHDLSTPAAFGGDEEDFSDTYHLDRQNGARLLRYVLAR
ncbi:MAG: hypothetical protein EXQ95_00995 [Alphaproteobacteria bacterium]|nr:hypothetical protein [Alphaproteobacteria bacterium]